MKKIILVLAILTLAVSSWAADTKISAMTDGTGTITSADKIPAVQGGANVYLTPAAINGLVTQGSLHVDDILTALGIASEATHFGTFTGSTIADSQTAKQALQALETSVETKAPTASPTFTGKVTTAASAAVAGAGFNLPHGTAPNSPSNGDCWTTTGGLYCYINGSTVGPYGTGGGGGYTNLTSFVDQTAWRIFYSNTSGDVTELALGEDGTYLKSNGATSAPTWATPGGSGDVSKVGTPTNHQFGVWTGDGTLKGVTVTGSKPVCSSADGEPVACTNLTDVAPLTSGGALGTPSSGTLTNCSGLPVSGISASTSTALGVGSIELGHASDTTVARSGAGEVTIEGVKVVTESSTNTVTNKTYDAAGTGNVLKQTKYLVLTTPNRCDETNAIMQTMASGFTFGFCKFADDIDKASNYSEYLVHVPKDLDTSVDLTLTQFSILLGGADTAAHTYEISMCNPAASAAGNCTPGNAISVVVDADASGADGDIEYAASTPITLTDWKSNMTAGRFLKIRVARDGDAAGDGSTVDSYVLGLVISYGSTL